MSNYEKGRVWEERIVRILKNRGYYAVRSAGSRGAWDVIAFKGDEAVFIQSKLVSTEGSRLQPIVLELAEGKKIGIKTEMALKYLDRGEIEKIKEFDETYQGGKRQVWVWYKFSSNGQKGKERSKVLIFEIPMGYCKAYLERQKEFDEMVSEVMAYEYRHKYGELQKVGAG